MRTIFEYLVGRREAILALARSPGALIASGLLVLSAALARNYDHEVLRHEPGRLLGPFVVSLMLSAFLFAIFHVAALVRGLRGVGTSEAFRAFLTLYWMAAPTAWMYGVPYERFLDVPGASTANLVSLGVASVWRVALFTRFVSILYGLKVRWVLPVLLALLAPVAYGALYALSPAGVMAAMSGAPEQMVGYEISRIAMEVTAWGCWLCPLAAIFAISRWRPRWALAEGEPPGSARRLIAFSVAAVVVWVALTIVAQADPIPLAYGGAEW